MIYWNLTQYLTSIRPEFTDELNSTSDLMGYFLFLEMHSHLHIPIWHPYCVENK